MRQGSTSLSGLDHLVEVLKKYGMGVDPVAGTSATPGPGELVLGDPWDPLLAETYIRFNGARFGDLRILHFDDPGNGFLHWNENERETWRELDPRVMKTLRYANEVGMACCLATVPELASTEGLQPVVYTIDYSERNVLPIASNVDRAFSLYARRCERLLQDFGTLDERDVEHVFPDAFIDDIIQDRPLIQMLREGRFDELTNAKADDGSSREWVQEVLAAADAHG